MKIGFRTPSLKKRVAARTSIKRAIRSKARVPRGCGFITNPKKAAYNRIYSRTTRKACYIATAVYGDQEAWQVEKFREYRDKKLMRSRIGRAFIRLYYTVSPKLCRLFRKGTVLNLLTRRILDAILRHI